MKKVILSVPEPCHEKWEEMTPVEKGRYCNSCRKTVIDFSQMTDAQLGAFFRKPVGSFCGRFHDDQLAREIVIPKKQIPWVKYFFQFTLPAFLFSIRSYSQKTSTQKQTVQTSEVGKVSRKPKAFSLIQFQKIKGQVIDSSGNPVPFATISVANSLKSTAADESGNFELSVDAEDSIIVSAISYQPVEQRIGDSSFVSITLNQKPAETKTAVNSAGMYWLGGAVINVVRVKSTQVVDTLFSNVSIFSNSDIKKSVINQDE